jgi:NAD-dependent DNA ligase
VATLLAVVPDALLDQYINPVQTVRERIKQRRAQMLVHSCVYYQHDDCIVDDNQWQKWANELRDLQMIYGVYIGYFDTAFMGWTGDSGFHLPYRHPSVMANALRLIQQRDAILATLEPRSSCS